MGAKGGLAGVGVGLGVCVIALTVVVHQVTTAAYRLGGADSEMCRQGSTRPTGAVEQAGVSMAAEDEIPAEMLELYQDAADEWGMDWAILAAVGYRESTHNTNRAVDVENKARALGPMQFTPPAWEHHGRYWGDKSGDKGTPPLEDRLDPATAVWSAAHKLTDQGVNSDVSEALIRYFGADDGYVDRVTSTADQYRDGEFSSGSGGEIVLATSDCPEEGTGIPGQAPDYSVGDLASQTHLEPCIVDDPPFSPGNIRPLTCAAHKNIVENFGPRLTNSGNCLRNGGGGDHPLGLACDYMTSPGGVLSTGDQEKLGDMIAEHAITNADVLGVKYVIWRKSIWNAGWTGCPPTRTDRTDTWHNNVPDIEGGKWCGMEDRGSHTENHNDHVHISYISS